MPPRERQKLQPRTPDVLRNVSDRYYREGNEGIMSAAPTSINPNNPNVNQMKNNYLRTSINPNTWYNSKYLGIGGADFVKDHAPE